MPSVLYSSTPFPTKLCVFLTASTSGGPISGVPFFAHAVVSGFVGDSKKTYDIPLGTLATDHAGFLSFDLDPILKRLETLQATGTVQAQTSSSASLDNLWVHPYSPIAQSIDVLNVENIIDNLIVLRLMVDPNSVYSDTQQGFSSLQSPNLSDWQLSPSSFSQMPAAIVGQDGCEAILPSNIASHEFTFFQIVPLPDTAKVTIPKTSQSKAVAAPGVAVTGIGRTLAASAVHDHVEFNNYLVPTGNTRLALAIDYDARWLPIGHGLGQILYSLPLAPGEQVNIAVVDWSRTSVDGRTENTGLSDSLQHDTLRDRTVGEVVDATLQEWQRGSSAMGGYSASGGYGGYIGVSEALGASFASTSGSRNVAAETTQKIADRFSQASTAVRDLRSTVVIQSVQKENQTLQTRTVRNHNHSHAMTLLYYEVLRHYRVIVERGAIRPVLLLRQAMPDFTDTSIFTYRRFLEPALLNTALKGGFDAIEILFALQTLNTEDPPPPPPDLGNLRFTLFKITFHLGGQTGYGDVSCYINNHTMTNEIRLLGPQGQPDDLVDPTQFDRYTNGSFDFQAVPATGSVAWKDLGFIIPAIDARDNGKGTKIIVMTGIDIVGVDTDGIDHPLGRWSGNHTYTQGFEEKFPVISCAAPPPPPPIPTPLQRLSEDQRRLYVRLLAHLNSNKAYYYRQIWLGEESGARYIRLVDATVDFLNGISLPFFEAVENRVIDVLGDQLVFPLNPELFDPAYAGRRTADALLLPSIQESRVERLISLPTRGVFGEAKLGHCNASEVIDNSRFWDWQTSPIPEDAPAITGISPVSGNVTQNLTPTTLPASMLSIQQPSPEPDPLGLRAALDVLKTPGIFNNLSGLDQLKGLLSTLADAAVKAQAISAGPAPATPVAPSSTTSAPPAGTPAPSGSGQSNPPTQTPQAPSAPTPPQQSITPGPSGTPKAPTPIPPPMPAKPLGTSNQAFYFTFEETDGIQFTAIMAEEVGLGSLGIGSLASGIPAPTLSGTVPIKDPNSRINFLVDYTYLPGPNQYPLHFSSGWQQFDQTSKYFVVHRAKDTVPATVSHKKSETLEGIKAALAATLGISGEAIVSFSPSVSGGITPTTGSEDTVTETYNVTRFSLLSPDNKATMKLTITTPVVGK